MLMCRRCCAVSCAQRRWRNGSNRPEIPDISAGWHLRADAPAILMRTHSSRAGKAPPPVTGDFALWNVAPEQIDAAK
jgi:hypothetical protein